MAKGGGLRKRGWRGGGGRKKMVEAEKTGVAREICTPINTLLYMSMTVRGGGRRRKREREGEGVILVGFKKNQLKTQHTFEEKK